MAVGFVAIATLLEPQPRPARKTGLLDPLKALGHKGLAATAGAAFFYNYAFFTVLAFTPFVLDMSPYKSGAVFFAWGVLLALFSVLVAPRLQARLGSVAVAAASLVVFAADLAVIAYGSKAVIVTGVIVSGALLGINNTVFTELALEVSDAPRPVASAGYNFVRWFAAAAAPYLAPRLYEHFDVHVPFLVATGTCVAAAGVLVATRRLLATASERHTAVNATPQPVPAPAG